MHLIVFTSTCTASEPEIRGLVPEIADEMRRASHAAGITGILICDQDRLLGAIEGDEQAVRERIARVKRDPRQRGVRIVVDQPVGSRSFPDWNADTFYLHDADIVEPETISHFRAVYERHFTMDGATFIRYLREMCDALDTFKILEASNG